MDAKIIRLVVPARVSAPKQPQRHFPPEMVCAALEQIDERVRDWFALATVGHGLDGELSYEQPL